MMFHSLKKIKNKKAKKKKEKALLPEQLVHLVLLHFSETQREPSALPPSPQETSPHTPTHQYVTLTSLLSE